MINTRNAGLLLGLGVLGTLAIAPASALKSKSMSSLSILLMLPETTG